MAPKNSFKSNENSRSIKIETRVQGDKYGSEQSEEVLVRLCSDSEKFFFYKKVIKYIFCKIHHDLVCYGL